MGVNFLIMCVVQRALLYSPPAETRLTVYRRLDIVKLKEMKALSETTGRTEHRILIGGLALIR